jgi:hypothetical protein
LSIPRRRRHAVPNVPPIQAARPVTPRATLTTLVSEGTRGVRDDHSEAMAGGVMRASVGDVLVLSGSEGRTGLIIGVVGKDGAPPYVIKWHSDGHIAMVTPDPYSRIIRAPGDFHPESPPGMSSNQA